MHTDLFLTFLVQVRDTTPRLMLQNNERWNFNKHNIWESIFFISSCINNLRHTHEKTMAEEF